MLRRSVSAVVLGVLAGCGPVIEEPQQSVTPKTAVSRDAIIGGQADWKDPEVYILDIQLPSGGYLCTGTLIAPRTILTAAHCIQPENGVSATVRVTNKSSLYTAKNADFVKAKSIYWPPEFVLANFKDGYDIAIVGLEREAWGPLKTWNQDSVDFLAHSGRTVRLVGYGEKRGAVGAGFKRTVDAPLGDIRNYQFDFGSAQKSTCHGDSGGPAFITFSDGSERTIGVTSGHSGDCGANFDTRIDFYKSNVMTWMAETEAPSCDADGRCATGCTTTDPDCACVEDGTCNPACSGKSGDPDCDSTCGHDGICSAKICSSGRDYDCQAMGGHCGNAGQCNGRLCITSPQHDDQHYCSQPCSATNACPTGFECVNSQCQYPVLPVAAQNDPCTPGATYCGGPEFVCEAVASDSQARCRHQCYETADCDPDYICTTTNDTFTNSFNPPDHGVCVKNIDVPAIGTQDGKAFGCASTGASFGGVGAMLALLGLMLRRR